MRRLFIKLLIIGCALSPLSLLAERCCKRWHNWHNHCGDRCGVVTRAIEPVDEIFLGDEEIATTLTTPARVPGDRILDGLGNIFYNNDDDTD